MLLDRVVQRYRRLGAYSDDGFVRHSRDRENVVTFETAFRAPNLFRFDFRSPHPYRPLRDHVTSHAVGLDHAGPYFLSCSYDGEKKIERDDSFAMFVAGATGISRGSAHTISTLLFKDVGGFELTRLRRVRFCRGATLDKTLCVGITGRHPMGGQITAFVGKKDLLIRGLAYRRFKQIQVRRRVHTHALHTLRTELSAPSEA